MAMNFPNNLPGVRAVVCMLCTWTWLTGSAAHPMGAKCPKCGHKGGVGAFMVIKPQVDGYIILAPDNWQA